MNSPEKNKQRSQAIGVRQGREFAAVRLSHLHPIRVSPVFDTYWRFATERQQVYFRRLEGRAMPWTKDPVLLVHKFTNAYRASDRVSQYLIRNVIYRPDLPSDGPEVVFRILLFKVFNKIETWELLEQSFGAITLRDYRFERYDKVLSNAMRAGSKRFGASNACTWARASVNGAANSRARAVGTSVPP